MAGDAGKCAGAIGVERFDEEWGCGLDERPDPLNDEQPPALPEKGERAAARYRCDGGLVVLPGESVARHVGVPVHEGAVGILFPGPDVQRIEGRKPEAVGAVE